MAAEHPTTRPDVTWRDAVTPLSRASRRRWTAAYALLLSLLAAGVVDDAFAVRRSDDEVIPFILIVAVPVVFGMLRRGTRRIAALDHPDLDERDIAARNAAYRLAYPLLVLVLAAAVVLFMAYLPDSTRDFRTGWFLDPNALVGGVLWILLWAIYLPTGVLAWREPDALEPEIPRAGLPEPIRDALLGLALAGAIALSLGADSDSGTLLFVAALALLGALARRAAGQPVMSRQRRLRVVIGVLLVLAIVTIGLLGALAGSESSGGGEVTPSPVQTR